MQISRTIYACLLVAGVSGCVEMLEPSETDPLADEELGTDELQLTEALGTGTIAFGSSVTATLGVGEAHAYRFVGQKNGAIRISLIAIASTKLDTLLSLYSTKGGLRDKELAHDDDGGDGLNSLIDNFVLPESAEYEIVASSYNGAGSGQYTLKLECLNNACVGTPPGPVQPIQPDVPVTDLSGAQDSWKYFSLVIPEGASDFNVFLTATGDADLFVTPFPSDTPLPSTFEHSSLGVSGNETLLISYPRWVRNIIGVKGTSSYTGGRLRATYTPHTAPVFPIIQNNSPTVLSGSASISPTVRFDAPAGVRSLTVTLEGGTLTSPHFHVGYGNPNRDDIISNEAPASVLVDDARPGPYFFRLHAGGDFKAWKLTVVAQ